VGDLSLANQRGIAPGDRRSRNLISFLQECIRLPLGKIKNGG
jgi:hypothetical protein